MTLFPCGKCQAGAQARGVLVSLSTVRQPHQETPNLLHGYRSYLHIQLSLAILDGCGIWGATTQPLTMVPWGCRWLSGEGPSPGWHRRPF